MPFVFGPPGKESLRNIFSYDPKSDTWTWKIENITNGKAEPFGDVALTRAEVRR